MEMIAIKVIGVEQLQEIVRQAIKDVLDDASKGADESRYLSVSEVCQLFAPPISRQTVHKLRKEGVLKAYFLSTVNRPMFRYTEVVTAIKERKTFNNRETKK